MRRARQQEWRAARLHRRLKLHQLGARSVRVVDIQLPLAVAPKLRAAVLGIEPVARVKHVVGLLNVVDAQREVISSVQTVLKSAAYIRSSAGGLMRTCDILRASVPANMPWIRNILLVGGDGRVQCSTGNSYVGIYLGDRPYMKKALATRDFVVSDFLLARGGNNPVVMLNVSAPVPPLTLNAWL